MADLDAMLNDLLRREGGYVNLKEDRGGCTNKGITIATLAEWREHPVTCDDVRNLSVAETKAIYTAFYYKRGHVDRLPDILQPIMLDSCVLCGIKQAWKFMQLALNEVDDLNLVVDGIAGDKTFAAIANFNYEYLLPEIIRQRKIFHQHIGVGNQAKFLQGWLNRLKEFEV